ncbi:peptidase M10A and M12B matrixin and adamalysin [Anabaena sp. FACHB-1237]|uniref:matrixin family metalloprotease n=1 Tax=Anabaena sp. FACHB-1237 TaxID=2692769 RepID=UPI00168135C9|nr:matrixin family metalloprotease [Anabaena sp. FACHB-1237]MBD2138179.1 peptidase M10A and M12B matrixin and adamalysin [Anabaena sp. FACHB-1237]
MSLYDRLNLTRPPKKNQQQKSQVPIWERINLQRPPRPRCRGCRSLIQTNWRICPSCGTLLHNIQDEQIRHCVWIDLSGMLNNHTNNTTIIEVITDALAKVFSAFRSIQVFLTSDQPDPKEWGNRYTHVYIFIDQQPVDYLGIASFNPGEVTNIAGVRIDQILRTAEIANLNLSQLSNLIANTITHEIGHTLGLDHSELATDVMHDGLDHRIHSLIPPSFHVGQMILMNKAICKYVKGNILQEVENTLM